MGANKDFITNNIVGHVVAYDNSRIAAALVGCTEENCDVRTYGGASSPNWARFWSQTLRSPQGSFWWMFELLGTNLPDNYPTPPREITSPWWHFAPNSFAAPAPQGLKGKKRQAR